MFTRHCVCEHNSELTRQHLPYTLTLLCRGLASHLISNFNLISNSWHCLYSHATAQACSTCAQGRQLGRCVVAISHSFSSSLQLALSSLNSTSFSSSWKEKKGLCKQSAAGTVNFQHQCGQALQNYLDLKCLFVPSTIILTFLLSPPLPSSQLVVQHTLLS